MTHQLNIKSLGLPLAKLIGLVNQHKELLLNQYLAPFNISSAQFKVLAAVHYYEINSPAELSKYLTIDGGSMTRMVSRLVKKELLDKQSNPKDKRAVILQLTIAGKVLLDQCVECLDNQVAPLLTGDLSVQEIELLSALLTRLLPPRAT
ncbi:MarR family transcriptional regulator [Psychromonas arctica]|uniref:MarR family transcriptional regulator n=1 Tax=Psychromonas arctica TaxID=168275 RepID=UPI00040D4F8F|nr:MarR family transcriptional regulator [Psychromonas arctica]